MNTIFIKNLKIYAFHGVFEEEKKQGQDFYVNATLYLDTTKAAATDDLEQAVNYGDVCHFITKLMKERSFALIEAAADYVVRSLLLHYPLLVKVSLDLLKPQAPIGLPFETVGVHVERAWHDAYLGIGSNMGDKKNYLDTAIESIREHPLCQVLKVSSYLKTEPYGYVEQDDFLNAALHIRTIFEPHELLDYLHVLENAAERKREIHWGPRTLDLDILFFDDLITEDEDLILPHPDLHHRAFVLEPLKEIAPYKIHPLLQKRIQEIEP